MALSFTSTKDKLKGNVYIETKMEFAKDAHFKFDFKAGPACNNDIYFSSTKLPNYSN